MIPQRNLSLLANRLYKERDGRRIPEAVLERDYCLAWFLVGLSQSKLRDLLIFKGGTALKRCHFGDYRFSEDLDFTLANRVEFAEIRAGLEEVYELVAQASAIRFSFEAEDRQTHVNSFTFYLRYQGPLPTSNTVKVDITVSEILLFPIAQLPVLRTYPEFEDVPEDRPVSVYSLNEIATEKNRGSSGQGSQRAARPLRSVVPDLSGGCRHRRSHRSRYGKTALSGERHNGHRRPDPRKRSSSEGAVERSSRASDGSVASV